MVNQGAIIRNNNCDQNSYWGIFSGFSENILIENNVASRSVQQHGIYFSNSADNPVIRGNISWGNSACGIHMNGDASSGGDGIISNALVENNVCYDNGLGGGSGINCDGVKNSTIRNNLIYNTHASGISLYRIDGGAASTGNVVVNNTVLVASNGRWAMNVHDGSTGNTIRNNIFYSAVGNYGAMHFTSNSLAGTVSDYNIVEDRFTPDDDASWISLSQWRTQTGLDAHSIITSNPSTLFVNAAGGDYHLVAGSAALDVGTTASAPPTDFEGTTRPSGNGVDIGYDEFAAGAHGDNSFPVIVTGHDNGWDFVLNHRVGADELECGGRHISGHRALYEYRRTGGPAGQLHVYRGRCGRSYLHRHLEDSGLTIGHDNGYRKCIHQRILEPDRECGGRERADGQWVPHNHGREFAIVHGYGQRRLREHGNQLYGNGSFHEQRRSGGIAGQLCLHGR